MNIKKLKITVLGKSYEVLVEELAEGADAVAPNAERAPQSTVVPIDTPELTEVTAPMGGTIMDIAVKPGDTVQAGDKLCVLEAMKMQNVIPSPIDGIVRQIVVAKDDAVDVGDLLITIEA